MLSAVPSNRRESSASNRLQQLLSGCSGGGLADFHSSIDRINLDSSLQSQLENSSAGEDGLAALSPIVENNSVNQLTATQNTASSVSTASTNTIATVTATTAAAAAAAAATATTPVPTTIAATTTAATSATSTATATATAAASTPAATSTAATASSSTAATASTSTALSSSSSAATVTTNPGDDEQRNPQTECRLRVANRNQRQRDQTEEVLRSFYVTPFAIDQTEVDILEYIKEISNAENSTLRCAKLVPRNKNIDELTFISFKVTVSDDLVGIVSDSFYWPEGVQSPISHHHHHHQHQQQQQSGIGATRNPCDRETQLTLKSSLGTQVARTIAARTEEEQRRNALPVHPQHNNNQQSHSGRRAYSVARVLHAMVMVMVMVAASSNSSPLSVSERNIAA
ncbi:pneumococcal serine-rich repeat protein-like [Ochlerotatus camptorhynchus]|uniref:pneumococcal serine-rich repeat protein-like n=1 Tax=Ochlerotatus camptorhynchus TaxID=644619 RepID=UPI0031DC519A